MKSGWRMADGGWIFNGLFLFLLSSILHPPSSISLWAQDPQTSMSTAAATTEEFTYKAKFLKDPFMAIAAGSLGGQSVSGGTAKEKSQKSVQDLEDAFEPDVLVLKAILQDKAQGRPIAYLASSADTNESYIVNGARIRHSLSGFTLPSFEAKIEKDSVVIKKIKGKTLMTVVRFRKKEEGTQ